MVPEFKPGDAVRVPKKGGGSYEGYISADTRYPKPGVPTTTWSRHPGTIVVGMNWDGDLVFVDQRPKDLELISIHELSVGMRRDAMELRQQHYRSQSA